MNETIKRNRANLYLGLGLAGFLGAVAIFLFFSAYMDWQEYNDSSDWQETQGTIIDVGTQEIVDNDDVFFAPLITYTYSVDNMEYTGDRLSFDNRAYVEQENAQEAAEEYTSGQNVTVIYKPTQPDRAVLIRTTNWSAISIYLAGGVVMLLVGAIITAGTLRTARDDPEKGL